MDLPKRPNHDEYEASIYTQWEKSKVFTPKIDPAQKPYTILLPPPNANAALHVGHVLYVVEDILCRYQRMKGLPTLFLPGTDHAGIETQFVLEKKLSKEGKSRLDYDRETLYNMIDAFVEENRGIATNQLRKLGFSLDWSREKYTLEDDILKIVFDTFRKLHEDGLIYRDERLVNYCTYCGTGFSNLEINHQERDDLIYQIDYGTITIATTRPETIFADVAVAVNPNDERYRSKIGKTAIIPIINREIPIIADDAVDAGFGTGALKITPGHDHVDYEIGQRHNLERISVIDRSGRMFNVPEPYLGKRIHQARELVVEILRENGNLIREEALTHNVATCYKCKHVIEPLLIPQWYIKIKPLVEKVVEKLDQKETRVFPKRFDVQLRRWLETAPDWNISRQIVWGPQIPIWYCVNCNPDLEITFLAKDGKTKSGRYTDLKTDFAFEEIRDGLQTLISPLNSKYQLTKESCTSCHQSHLLQETDTFDTWFSSGQWPLTTLGYPDNPDFKYFYPTAVLDTMWDILPFWVMRMLLLCVYRTGQVPFEWAHMHARVVDSKGQKMSKSKGNVVNPMEVVEKYGADALRMALVFGVAPASDIAIGDEKMIGMRNFVTKIWNIARFVIGQIETSEIDLANLSETQPKPEDLEIIEKLNQTINEVSQSFNKFQFARASESIYNFIWHEFADVYIESTKPRLFDAGVDQNSKNAALSTLLTVFTTTLSLLHPFMPFVTEEIYQKLPDKDSKFLTTRPWPKIIK